MSEVEVDPEQDTQVLTEDIGEQELLQQFQTVDEDGNTIVLTAEQLQSYHEQVQAEQEQAEAEGHVDTDADTQVLTDEILEEEHIVGDGEDVDLETHHTIIDEHGNHQLVTGENLQDLITLHSVDADGNIVTNEHPIGEDEHLVDGMEGIHMDQSALEEAMIHTDHIEEEVITSGEPEEDNYTLRMNADTDNIAGNTDDLTQPFLSVRDSVFNPVTGTLQPISTAMPPPALSAPPPVKQKRPAKQQQVKYILAQQPGGQQPRQLILNAQQLQGLLQGGGNTITLNSATGKQSVFLSQGSPQKGKAGKSPTKILPAPVPVGDQQQGSSPQPQRFLLKQGNTLTSIPTMTQAGGTKLFQMPTGSGGQIQYVRVVPNKQPPPNKLPIPASKPKLVAPKPSQSQTIFALPHGTTAADINNMQNAQGLGNFVVLPNYLQMKTEQNSPISIRPSGNEQAAAEAAMLSLQQSLAQSQAGFDSIRSLLEPNGMRPRKPCNCTKSQCLKLYCDCFANGEFCHLCNCTNCYNNLNHEEDRQKAIKLVLERNPGAFRPKIGKSSQTGEAHERRHNKGCNCRRSGCLKNYCECYEAKIFCSGICKCSGCKNCIENIPSGLANGSAVEQHFAGAGTSHRQTLKDLAEAAEVRVQQQNQVKNKMKAQWSEVSPQNNLGVMVPPCVFRHPHGSISYEVVTSTVELLLAKAEAGERQKLSEGELERIIVEEFGECLASLMELGTTIGSSD